MTSEEKAQQQNESGSSYGFAARCEAWLRLAVQSLFWFGLCPWFGLGPDPFYIRMV
jgi:hypothetical protein